MNFIEPNTLPFELRNNINYRNLKEGEILFNQGDKGHNLYAIAYGRIKLTRTLDRGQSIVLQFLESGNLLGEDALSEGFYNYNAISQTKTRIVIYPQNVLQFVLSNNPLLVTYLRKLLIERINACYRIIELRAIKNAPQRILQYLHYLVADKPQKKVAFQKPFKEIAAELDFTPETVSRTLAQLERDGSIGRQRNYIILHDPNLVTLTTECCG